MCEVFEFVALDRDSGDSGGSKIICGPIALVARDESHAMAVAGGIIRGENPDLPSGRLEVVLRRFHRTDDNLCRTVPFAGG